MKRVGLAVILFASLLTLVYPVSPVFAANGDLDPSFGGNGIVTIGDGTVHSVGVAIQADGKILTVGTDTSEAIDFALVRHNTDGSLDANFGTEGTATADFNGAADNAKDLAIQSDGKIVVVGSTSSSGNVSQFALARHNPDGSPDAEFGTNGQATVDFGALTDTANDVLLQADGGIVVLGNYTPSFEGGAPTYSAMARFTSAGKLDSGFGTGGKVTGSVATGLFVASALQPDQRIVVLGPTTDDRSMLVRYNYDGSLDESFGSAGYVFTGAIRTFPDLVVQADGKIVATGRHPSDVPGSTPGGVFLSRFNFDGTIDASYGADGTVPISSLVVLRLAMQADNKVVAAGTRRLPDGAQVFGLARYNADGTLDQSFGSGGEVTTEYSDSAATLYGVAIQPDGRIVAVGNVESYSPLLPRRRPVLARYFGDSAPLAICQGDGDRDHISDCAERLIGTSPSLGDTDGDGLDDAVEVDPGIPGAGVWLDDGQVVDRDRVFDYQYGDVRHATMPDGRVELGYSGLVKRPDPLRKDLYFEIDWQDCLRGNCPEPTDFRRRTGAKLVGIKGDPMHHAPDIEGLRNVRDVFKNAPVPNPDGSQGINLHLLVDEAVPHTPNCEQGNTGIRSTYFGTAFQQLDRASHPEVLTAREQVFRYVWSGHSTAEDSISGKCPTPLLDSLLKQGHGEEPLAAYDWTPFGSAAIGGRDINISLGPVWNCSSRHRSKTAAFGPPVPVCFRTPARLKSGFGGVVLEDPSTLPGIFPALVPIEVNGEVEIRTLNVPINRLLGLGEDSGSTQLWGRALAHLIGHSIGLTNGDVRNTPDEVRGPGLLLPDSYSKAGWAEIADRCGPGVDPSFCPLRVPLGPSTGKPHKDGTPHYDLLAGLDSDNDGVVEREDNCPGIPNLDQADEDDDGIGDVCDLTPDGTFRGMTPLNSAGVPLAAETTASGPPVLDTDRDGIVNQDDSDDDGDGVMDHADNCRLGPNPDQADNDGDKVGDACDQDDDKDGTLDEVEEISGSNPLDSRSGPEFLGDDGTCGDGIDNDGDSHVDAGDEGCVDGDGDSLPDFRDNCPALANQGWADDDEDTVGHACDNEVEVDPAVPAVVTGSGSSRIAWRSHGGGDFSVRIGASDCTTGSSIAAGRYTAPDDSVAQIEASLLGEGENIIRVCVRADDGTTSSATAILTKDSIAPFLSPPDLDPRSDGGGSATDNVTGAGTPIFVGAAEPGAAVSLMREGVVVAQGAADAAGNWELTDRGSISDGRISYKAKAIDSANNVTASANLGVSFDRVSPETKITSGPGEGASTAERWATLEFSSSEAGVNFTCSVDGAGPTPCNSPMTLTNLLPGQHSFDVTANDVAGNTDGTPERRRWTVTTTMDTYAPLTPARLVDTRPGQATVDGALAGGGGVPGGSSVNVTVTGRGGVPATGVGAVVLNVTAVDPTTPSHLTVWPAGEARPNASNLNFVAGQTVPNLVIAKVGGDGQVSVFNNSGSTHLVIDVAGWFPSG